MFKKKFKLFIWNQFADKPLDSQLNTFLEENDVVYHDVKYSVSATTIEKSALLVYTPKMKFGEPKDFTIPD